MKDSALTHTQQTLDDSQEVEIWSSLVVNTLSKKVS